MKTGIVFLFKAGGARVFQKFVENRGLAEVKFSTVKHFGSGLLKVVFDTHV